MAEPFIYGGHGSNGTVYIYDRAGNAIKEINLLRYESSAFRPENTPTNLAFGIINKIKVDSDGCIYVVLNYSESSGYALGGSIRKYGPAGSLKWVQTNMWSCGDLDIDNNGNVYAITPGTGEPEDWPGSVRKYNTDGVLQWAKTAGGLAYDPWTNQAIPICAKSDGSLIVAGNIAPSFDARSGLTAYDGDGTILWNRSDIPASYGIVIDEDDNDYIYVLTGGITKLSSVDGSTIQTRASYYDISGIPRSLAQDHNGDFIAVMSQINGKSAYKFDSDLNILWVGSSTAPLNVIRGNATYDVDCDQDGNIYVLNQPIGASGAALSARDNDGQPVWAITDPSGGFRCLTVNYPTSLPPIEISVSLGVPTWEGDRYINVPGLPVGLALGTVQAWRDYIGARKYPEVYRLYLTGTPHIELPLSSLQCRSDRNTLTLSLVVPGVTSDLIAAIEARLTGELVLMKGIRFENGIEQIDEMLRVPLDSLRYDLGPQSGSASLAGTIANSGGGRVRTLNGISYRNTIGGVRRVRCAVDTYLQPGDTANLGAGETLVVTEIVYSVSLDQATMEIVE